jgi:hypothetical protein
MPMGTWEKRQESFLAGKAARSLITDEEAQSLGSEAQFLVVLAIAFFASRFLYFDIGVRFDSTLLFSGIQFLDVNLLQHRLIESIFYLHCQPPLFNLLLGVMLKAFPGSTDTAFHVLFMGFGLILVLSMYGVSRMIGVPAFLALAITILYLASPTTVLYENLLLYTYPTASLLCLSALLLAMWVRTGRRTVGVAFFSTLSAVILTRSVFQIPWFVAAGLIVAASGRTERRSVVGLALVPFLIVCSWQAKNYVQFGSVATSTWLGLNMTRNTVERLSPDRVTEMMRAGRVSALAAVPALSEFEAYGVGDPQPTGIPALDQKVKERPSVGSNYNFVGYIQVSTLRLQDALTVIAAYPAQFAENVLDAVAIWLRPAFEALRMTRNAEALEFLDPVLVTQGAEGVGRWLSRGLVGLCYIVALLYGAAVTVHLLRDSDISPCWPVMAFMWLTVLYAAIVVNLTEIWENNRIRFMTDPYVWIMVAAALTHIPWMKATATQD